MYAYINNILINNIISYNIDYKHFIMYNKYINNNILGIVMPDAIKMRSIDKSMARSNDFSLRCSLDKKSEITSLALDSITLVADGKIAPPKQIPPSSVKMYKKQLETEFRKSFPNYKSFTLESNGDSVRLKPSGLKKIVPFSSSIKLSPETTKRIFAIQDMFLSDRVFGKIAVHNVKQLKATPKTNTIISILLLTMLTAGILAGTIGLGALLPAIGLIAPSFGIIGISMPITIGLVSAGGLSILGYGAMHLAAKKSKVVNEYLKDIHYKKSQAFLESNINDIAGGAYLLLLAATFLKFSFKTTLEGCLKYPGGILLIASGIYQLVESIKALINAKAISNKEALIKASVNIVCSVCVTIFGVLTTVSLINSFAGIAMAFGIGITSVIVASLSLKNSAKQLKSVYRVDENNPQEIIQFLKNNLSLDDGELKALREKVESMTKEECLVWIKKNFKNFEEKQKAKWRKFQEQLQNAKESELVEIRKLILREEIKNAQERKIENFGALVNKNTLIQTLETLETSLDDDEKIKAVFKKIKTDNRNKTIAEFTKIFIVNIPMMTIPLIQPLMSLGLYDVLLASTFLLNMGVNLNPGFRNVAPTMLKKALDINRKLRAYPIAKDSKDPSVKKVA